MYLVLPHSSYGRPLYRAPATYAWPRELLVPLQTNPFQAQAQSRRTNGNRTTCRQPYNCGTMLYDCYGCHRFGQTLRVKIAQLARDTSLSPLWFVRQNSCSAASTHMDMAARLHRHCSADKRIKQLERCKLKVSVKRWPSGTSAGMDDWTKQAALLVHVGN